ncbi:MAG: alkaline phosphatase family protein [Vicinamibacteria bacterium]|nr:alkaline phosphatase family protein [Vicinamibacteria bacterium]
MKQTGVVVGLVLCLLASLGMAARMWAWVLNFDPGFVFNPSAASTGPPISSGVTVLLVDGLRLDASRRMATLNSLRARGADIEGHVGTPSFSRPGRATLVVGAPPDIHGVTTNRQRRMLAIDNLFRRVGAMGGTCRVAGSKIWPGLFADDIARCGVYQPGEAKEGPGAFVRQVPGVRAAQEKGLGFILEQPAVLRIADIISTDFAAHEYGGASPEYAAEVARADAYLADLVGRLDLSKETLVVTADHGHRDAGGHGGEEPAVLAIPIVMVGVGITPSTSAVADQADIAPTIAALLGLTLPAGSSGHVLVSVLAADDAKLQLVQRASAVQEGAFGHAARARFGPTAEKQSDSDWTQMRRDYQNAARSARTPTALFLTAATLLGVGFSVFLARPGAIGPIAGFWVAILTFLGPVRSLLPPLSFSAINYDDLLVRFFSRIMILAALATLGSLTAAGLADRFLRKGRRRHSASAVAGVTGLLVSTSLFLATMAAWLNHGLLLPFALPGPDRMVEGYALTLALASVALTSLIAVALLRAVEARTSAGLG